MKFFNFYKSTPGTVWNIAHNLGSTVLINDVMVNINGTIEKIIPASVEIIDSNNLQISFTEPFSGYVRMIAGPV